MLGELWFPAALISMCAGQPAAFAAATSSGVTGCWAMLAAPSFIAAACIACPIAIVTLGALRRR